METNRKKTYYLQVDKQIELYVEEAGTGDPLLFIPGLTYSTEIFTAQMDYFSRDYHVITYDPRGQGRSTKLTHGNNYALHGQDVASVIDSLGLENVTIIGWSAGATAAWHYVRKYGTDKLKAAVCIDMPPKPLSANTNDWVEASEEVFAIAINDLLTTQEGQRSFFKDYAEGVMIQKEMNEEELNFLVDLSNRTPCNITCALLADIAFEDNRPDLTKMQNSIPTKMYIAEHWSDIAVPYINKGFPKVSIEVFGGHLMFYEYPERFNASLQDFLNEKV